jgi:VRR-NUC domain
MTLQLREYGIQVGVADALRIACAPGWAWTHIPNGEKRDKATAAKLWRMGVQPGWPDLVLVSPSGRLHCLELKRDKQRLSAAQEDFRDLMVAAGVPWAVARSIEEACRVLTAWGAMMKLRVSA